MQSTCEIKSSISVAKAAFIKKTLFSSKTNVNLRKKLVKCYICTLLKLEHSGK